MKEAAFFAKKVVHQKEDRPKMIFHLYHVVVMGTVLTASYSILETEGVWSNVGGVVEGYPDDHLQMSLSTKATMLVVAAYWGT